jgi:hypothetical protein
MYYAASRRNAEHLAKFESGNVIRDMFMAGGGHPTRRHGAVAHRPQK